MLIQTIVTVMALLIMLLFGIIGFLLVINWLWPDRWRIQNQLWKGIQNALFNLCQIIGSLLGVLIFLVFALMPFHLIWSIGSTDILTCRHPFAEPPVCQHQSWRLLGSHYRETEWQLQRVAVVESYDSEGGYFYSLALETSQGKISLPSYYSSNREKAYQDFSRLNQLIEQPSQSQLILKGSSGLLNSILMFFVTVFLFAMALLHD